MDVSSDNRWIFVIMLAGGLALVSTVMAFVFGVSLAVQKISFALNFNAASAEYLMAFFAFLSICAEFNIYCYVRFNFK